jgi:malonyl-CoA O-methyltransferase
MTVMIQKSYTAKQFSRAAEQYTEHARVQKATANLLFERLISDAHVLLDLGAGPLHHESKLINHCDYLIALDLCVGMLSQTKADKGIYKLCADMDRLPFQEDTISCVYSNFAIQWSSDPNLLFNSLFKACSKGAQVLISTVLEGSLLELSQAWHQVDNKSHINQFLTLNKLASYAESAGFELVYTKELCIKDEYECPLDAIKSLKKIGANHLNGSDRGKGLLGKQAYKKLIDSYPLEEGKAKVSYQVGILELKKQ